MLPPKKSDQKSNDFGGWFKIVAFQFNEYKIISKKILLSILYIFIHKNIDFINSNSVIVTLYEDILSLF